MSVAEDRGGQIVRCPEGYSYGFRIAGMTPSKTEEVLNWCQNHFGRGNGYRRWSYDAKAIFFRYDTDALEYKMRWQ
jgi:hypothetical protein